MVAQNYQEAGRLSDETGDGSVALAGVAQEKHDVTIYSRHDAPQRRTL